MPVEAVSDKVIEKVGEVVEEVEEPVVESPVEAVPDKVVEGRIADLGPDLEAAQGWMDRDQI